MDYYIYCPKAMAGIPLLNGFNEIHNDNISDGFDLDEYEYYYYASSNQSSGMSLCHDFDNYASITPSTLVIYEKGNEKITTNWKAGCYCVSYDDYLENKIEQSLCKFLKAGTKDINWKNIIENIKSPTDSIIICDRYLFQRAPSDFMESKENPYKTIKNIIEPILKSNEEKCITTQLLIVFDAYSKSYFKYKKEYPSKEKIRKNFDRISQDLKEILCNENLTIELLAFNDVYGDYSEYKNQGKEEEYSKHKRQYRKTHDRKLLTNYTLGVATYRISGFLEDNTVIQDQMIEVKSIFNTDDSDFNDSPLEVHKSFLADIVDIWDFLCEYKDYGCYSKNGEWIEISENVKLENRLINYK